MFKRLFLIDVLSMATLYVLHEDFSHTALTATELLIAVGWTLVLLVGLVRRRGKAREYVMDAMSGSTTSELFTRTSGEDYQLVSEEDGVRTYVLGSGSLVMTKVDRPIAKGEPLPRVLWYGGLNLVLLLILMQLALHADFTSLSFGMMGRQLLSKLAELMESLLRGLVSMVQKLWSMLADSESGLPALAKRLGSMAGSVLQSLPI